MTSFADPYPSAPGVNGGGGGDVSRTATVQLDANTSNYQSQMRAAQASTAALTAGVTQLGFHVDSLFKMAGRGLKIVSAADIGLMSTAVATAASLQQQMGTLSATAAITGKSMHTFNDAVGQAFSKFPNARGQIVDMVQSLAGLSVGSKYLGQITQAALKLDTVLGEQGVGASLVALDRTMGVSQARFGNYANAVATLAKNAGVSGSGIVQQAQMIAPISRMAGLRGGQIVGVGAAMQRSGASAGTAATMWNQMLTDIVTMSRTGDPNLAMYSTFAGMSQGRLRGMMRHGQAGQVMGDIFSRLRTGGPQALQFVNQMGWGPRGISAAQALSQAGLGRLMNMGQGATANQTNLNKGFEAATSNFIDKVHELHNQMTILIEQIGAPLLRPLGLLAEALTKFLAIINRIVAAPGVHQMLSLAGVVAAPVAGAGAMALGHIPFLMAASMVSMMRRTGVGTAFRGGRMAGAGMAATGAEAEVGNAILAAGGARAALSGGNINARALAGYQMGRGFGMMFGPGGAPGGPGGLRRGLAYGMRAVGLGGQWAWNLQAQQLRDARLRGFDRSAYEGTDLGSTNAATRASAAKRLAAERMETDALLRNAGLMGVAGQQVGTLGRAAGKVAAEATKFGASMAAAGAKWGIRAGVGGVKGAAGRVLFGPSMPSYEARVAAEAKVLEAEAAYAVAMRERAAIAAKGGAGMAAADKAYQKAMADLDAALIEQAAIARQAAGRGLLGGGPGGMGRLGGLLGVGRSRLGTALGWGIAGSVAGSLLPGTAGRIAGGIGTGAALGSFLGPWGTLGGAALGGLYGWLHHPAAPSGPSPALVQAQRAVPGQAREIQAALAMGGNVDAPTVRSRIMAYAHKEGMVSAAQKAGISPDDLYRALTGRAPRGRAAAAVVGAGVIPGGVAAAGDTTSRYGQYVHGGQAPPGTPPALAFLSRWGAQGGNETSMAQMRLLTGAVRRGTAAYQAGGAGGGTPLGQWIAGSRQMQSAMYGAGSGSPAAQQRAMEAASAAALKFAGNSTASVVQLNKLADAAGGSAGALLHAAAQWNRMMDDFAVQYKSRSQQLATLAGRVQAERPAAMAPGASKETVQQYTSDVSAYQTSKQSYNQYLISLYQQTRDFGIQMQRMHQQYNITVSRQDRDFHRSQVRAEADYQRSRSREIRDFNRSQLYAQQDYQTQVFRTTQDFHTQMKREAQQAAQSIYNPFQVVQAEEVAGAGMTLTNLLDQNRRINQQRRQLQQARREGLSVQAIRTLDLANPANAQQLDQIVRDLTNQPGLARRINQQVGIRVKGTTKLTQNTLNTEFANTIEDFHRGMDRMSKDYDRAHNRALQQQHTALSDMAKDYHTTTHRMQVDENTALGDMADDFHRTVNQTTADMTRSMTELYGSFATNTTKAIKQINKTFGQYAPQLANTLIAQINQATAAIQNAANVTYGQPGGGPTGYSTGVAARGVPGNAGNQRLISGALLGAGVRPQAVAGIMGNISQESGFSPTAGRGTAHQGIAQWGGSRWTALRHYARSRGKSVWDLSTQVDFMIHEAQQRGTLRQIGNAAPGNAASLWNDLFEGSGEKPGDPGWANRVNRANAWYAAYQRALRSGALSSGWTHGRSPVGRWASTERTDQGKDWGGHGPLFAVADGKFISVRRGGTGWPGGTFMVEQLDHPPSPDRRWVYYAEYINPGVRQGQRVRQGQVVGHATGGGIEVGWAAGPNSGSWGNTLAHERGHQAPGSDPGERPSPEGSDFYRWITGQPSGRARRRNRLAAGYHDFSGRGFAKGGIIWKHELAQIAEKGPEAVIPLDDRGHTFLRELYQRIAADLKRMQQHPTHQNVDERTNLREALRHVAHEVHRSRIAELQAAEHRALRPILHDERTVEDRLKTIRRREEQITHQLKHDKHLTHHERVRLQEHEKALDNREKAVEDRAKRLDKHEERVRAHWHKRISDERDREWRMGQAKQYREAHQRQRDLFERRTQTNLQRDALGDLGNVLFGAPTKHDWHRYERDLKQKERERKKREQELEDRKHRLREREHHLLHGKTARDKHLGEKFDREFREMARHLHTAGRGVPGRQHEGNVTYNNDHRNQYHIHEMHVAATDASKIQRELDQLARLHKLTAPAHH